MRLALAIPIFMDQVKLPAQSYAGKKWRRKDINRDLCGSKDHAFVPCGPISHYKMANPTGELSLFIFGDRRKGHS